MASEPSEWAKAEGERLLNHAMALTTPDYNRLHAAVANALDAARAEGRREGRIDGLHEAAAEALMDHRHLDEDGDYSGCVVCAVSRDILALADGEVKRG